MRLKVGFEMDFECPRPTPMILLLNIHYSHAAEMVAPDRLTIDPPAPLTAYRDAFGNWCSRTVAGAGRTRIATDAVVRISPHPDTQAPTARQTPVEALPEETLQFLVGSRYCETDHLTPIAWNLFGATPEGWARVQAICDFVHKHIAFGYEHARATKSAFDVYKEGKGVCRDYAHLGIAFCRAMNIPARYCTGYLPDIQVPVEDAPMDFAGWFEAWLDGRWYTFDPRNNTPRIGRVLIGRGRDAADVPLSMTFGPNTLAGFKVWADELKD